MTRFSYPLVLYYEHVCRCSRPHLLCDRLNYYVKYNSSIRATALFIGIGPIVFNALYRGIMATVYDKPLSSIFTLGEMVTAFLQLLLAFVVLAFARRNEESIAMTWAILVSGGILSYAILPGVISWIVTLF